MNERSDRVRRRGDREANQRDSFLALGETDETFLCSLTPFVIGVQIARFEWRHDLVLFEYRECQSLFATVSSFGG